MTDRSEWLAWRKAGLGGSDVAALVGLSPWNSPWSVWASKCLDLPDKDASEAMEFGLRAEPMLAQWFHDATGLYVAGEQTWCSHLDEPWMRCTVDGFVFDGPTGNDQAPDFEDALGDYEAKTTGDGPWDEVPAHYQCQAQWTMAVTGHERVMFGVLHLAFGRPQFRVYELARDEDDIALLTSTARSFWVDHVLTGTPPPTDGTDATTDALAAAWEPMDGFVVEANEDIATTVAWLHDLKAEVKDKEAAITALENELRAEMAEATAITHGVDDKGKPRVLCTWKPQPRTTVDAAALKAEMPDVAAKFSKTSTSRVLRLTTNKGK